MRKIRYLAIVSLVLLMAIPLFAQSPRQHTSSEGKSGFGNIAVRGLNATGVPGYIEFSDGDGDIFYLYVDINGVLRIASEPAVGFGASPATTSWSRTGTSGEVGIVVGGQSNID
jgi:hypothetical protein